MNIRASFPWKLLEATFVLDRQLKSLGGTKSLGRHHLRPLTQSSASSGLRDHHHAPDRGRH